MNVCLDKEVKDKGSSEGRGIERCDESAQEKERRGEETNYHTLLQRYCVCVGVCKLMWCI